MSLSLTMLESTLRIPTDAASAVDIAEAAAVAVQQRQRQCQ